MNMVNNLLKNCNYCVKNGIFKNIIEIKLSLLQTENTIASIENKLYFLGCIRMGTQRNDSIVNMNDLCIINI